MARSKVFAGESTVLNRIRNSAAFWFALASPVLAEQPTTTLGITSERPPDGISVRVGELFMVPYTERIPGTDVTFEMVPIPGGTFLMGSPESEEGHKPDEGPQIKVSVEPMWVAKLEVRWDGYQEFMGLYDVFTEFEAAGIRQVTPQNRVDAITAPTPLYRPSFTYENGDEPDQPAVTMTQYAAQHYSKWLSAITGHQYRLPTEAEWEYACRGGSKAAFSWGDDPDEAEDHAWFFDNADEGQVPGGQKQANGFGLFDMHGNVGEWTVNAYTKEGYAWLAKQLDGDKSIDAIASAKWPETANSCVVRGGTWESDPKDLRCAARMASQDKKWKSEDPNFPHSPWWFTSDPARGVGLRLFRSYAPLDADTINKFWNHIAPDASEDVQARLDAQQGKLGLVDKDLPAAIQENL